MIVLTRGHLRVCHLVTKSIYRHHSTDRSKLIYEGKLTKRILYLKSVSILSSLGLGGSYTYVISQKGFTIAMAGIGFAFTPFLLSPFVIAWFFNRKSCSFKKEDVTLSDVSILSTFKVGKRPFFLHDEDLVDTESIELYKKMVGLNNVQS